MGNTQVFCHRLPALTVSSLSTAGVLLAWASGSTCSFLTVTSKSEHDDPLVISDAPAENDDGDAIPPGDSDIGVFCDPPFYDRSGDTMWNVSRSFLIAALSVGSAAALTAWAIGTVWAPTDANWKCSSVLSAVAAVLLVPVFLLFEAEPCTGYGESHSCGPAAGSFLLICSTACHVAAVVLTQCLDPPRWADELDAWRFNKRRLEGMARSDDADDNDEEDDGRGLVADGYADPYSSRKAKRRTRRRGWLGSKVARFFDRRQNLDVHMAITESDDEWDDHDDEEVAGGEDGGVPRNLNLPAAYRVANSGDGEADGQTPVRPDGSYYANSTNSRLLLHVTPDGKRVGDDQKSEFSFRSLDEDVRYAESQRMRRMMSSSRNQQQQQQQQQQVQIGSSSSVGRGSERGSASDGTAPFVLSEGNSQQHEVAAAYGGESPLQSDTLVAEERGSGIASNLGELHDGAAWWESERGSTNDGTARVAVEKEKENSELHEAAAAYRGESPFQSDTYVAEEQGLGMSSNLEKLREAAIAGAAWQGSERGSANDGTAPFVAEEDNSEQHEAAVANDGESPLESDTFVAEERGSGMSSNLEERCEAATAEAAWQGSERGSANDGAAPFVAEEKNSEHHEAAIANDGEALFRSFTLVDEQGSGMASNWEKLHEAATAGAAAASVSNLEAAGPLQEELGGTTDKEKAKEISSDTSAKDPDVEFYSSEETRSSWSGVSDTESGTDGANTTSEDEESSAVVAGVLKRKNISNRIKGKSTQNRRRRRRRRHSATRSVSSKQSLLDLTIDEETDIELKEMQSSSESEHQSSASNLNGSRRTRPGYFIPQYECDASTPDGIPRIIEQSPTAERISATAREGYTSSDLDSGYESGYLSRHAASSSSKSKMSAAFLQMVTSNPKKSKSSYEIIDDNDDVETGKVDPRDWDGLRVTSRIISLSNGSKVDEHSSLSSGSSAKPHRRRRSSKARITPIVSPDQKGGGETEISTGVFSRSTWRDERLYRAGVHCSDNGSMSAESDREDSTDDEAKRSVKSSMSRQARSARMQRLQMQRQRRSRTCEPPIARKRIVQVPSDTVEDIIRVPSDDADVVQSYDEASV